MNSNSNILKLIIRLQRNVLLPCTTNASTSSSTRCVIGSQFDQQRHASGRSPVPLMGLGKGEIHSCNNQLLDWVETQIKRQVSSYLVLAVVNINRVLLKVKLTCMWHNWNSILIDIDEAGTAV